MAVRTRGANAPIALLLIATLSGCLEPGRPLVADRSSTRGAEGIREYTVRQGDTLYSIAWRFELDYRGLARANGIDAPYLIRPGRRLRLTSQPPAGQRMVTAKPRASVPPAPSTAPTALSWMWPLPLQPAVEFSRSSKGVDYVLGDAGGMTAKAAAAGQVVYAGSGLGGYERLVIVKHDATLLSAYGFDGSVDVAENQQIAAGAALGRVKNRGAAKPSLHFELRRNGEPIDPRSRIRPR